MLGVIRRAAQSIKLQQVRTMSSKVSHAEEVKEMNKWRVSWYGTCYPKRIFKCRSSINRSSIDCDVQIISYAAIPVCVGRSIYINDRLHTMNI